MAGLVVLAAAVLAALAWRVRDWVVMTDELQYTKLATSIADTLSPLPTLRGLHFSAYAQLYPALLAPLYGTMTAPDAFRAAHVLNGVLFATAAIPAYLLAREASLSRRWSLFVAVVAVVVAVERPHCVPDDGVRRLPGLSLDDAGAAASGGKPSPQRDLIALGALAAAVLARTQLVALGLVFVVTALLYERRGHRVLAVATVGAVVVAAAAGSRVLGSYAVTADRWPLPWKAFEQAGAHLDEAAIGVALLPLLLGGAWIVANVRRDPFALLALVTIVVLTLEVSSYDARFGGGLTGIRDRYLFYLAPLLVVAMARALAGPAVPRVALAATTAFVAVTVLAHDFPRIAGVYVDDPVAVHNGWIHDAGGAAFVAAAAFVLALAVVLGRRSPSLLAIASVAFVLAGALSTSAVAWSRLLTSRSPSSREISAAPTVVLNWIDTVVPKGADVAIVPYAGYQYWGPNALLWWDVEFWNKTVDDAYVIDGRWDYAPFPHQHDARRLDHGRDCGHRGRAALRRGGSHRRAPPSRRRGEEHELRSRCLEVERPYRAAWISRGLDPDGWTRPGRRASIHVFGDAA